MIPLLLLGIFIHKRFFATWEYKQPKKEISIKWRNKFQCVDPDKYFLVDKNYSPIAQSVDEQTAYLSFGNWRFNVRGSNTEGLLRLNVEAKEDKAY